ncbi:MAG TPA: PTS sugar transporter subunit IIA [Propionicimonas sp.]|jgi:PTS system galactitol-specific IIA component|uniref:PTS sugar transporter subunit IIA n=1 Tax=Propionicimonas sp. TaxID=1955623 RepID=UPI002F4140C8
MTAVAGLELLSGCALHRVAARDREHLLRMMAAAVVDNGHGKPSLVDALVERERRFPTGLPTPVPSAIPHTDAIHVLHSGLAVATLAEPVTFAQMGGSGEELLARIVVMLCITHPGEQVGALQLVLGRLSDQAPVEELLDHADASTFEGAVRDWLADNDTVRDSAGDA